MYDSLAFIAKTLKDSKSKHDLTQSLTSALIIPAVISEDSEPNLNLNALGNACEKDSTFSPNNGQ